MTTTATTTLSRLFTFQDLGITLLTDLIATGVGILATYYIVEKALEKRRLAKKLKVTRPIAREALSSRLWAVVRIIGFDVYPLLNKSIEEIRHILVPRLPLDVPMVDPDHFTWIFDQLERLLDVYGDSLEYDVQEALLHLANMAAEVGEAMNFIITHREVIDEIPADAPDSLESLKVDLLDLAKETEKVVDQLVAKDLMPKLFSDRLVEMKQMKFDRFRRER